MKIKKKNLKKSLSIKKNLSKKIFVSALAISSLSIAGTSIIIPLTTSNGNDTSLNTIVTDNATTETNATVNDVKPLVPAQNNMHNANLSTPQGPIVYFNNKITSLDWFGAERWTIDMGKVVGKEDNYTGSWLRAWFNWDYDRSRDLLWVLSYGQKSGNNGAAISQKLYKIQGSSGQILGTYDTGLNGEDLKFVSALSSGNVLIWYGATVDWNAKAYLWETSTQKIRQISGNSSSAMSGVDGGTNFKWYYTNTIPIKSGYNLVTLQSFPRKSSTGDGGYPDSNLDVYFILVDDNLNMIANSGTWSKPQKAASGLTGYRNSTITAQRDYYSLLDGRVATIIYDQVIMINPNDNTADSNVSFKNFTTYKAEWIQSWSFDTNQNLYFKYRNDTVIYKVSTSDLDSSDNKVNASTYYDLASSGVEKIKKYAGNYAIYNVYGYQGQIMLVNAQYNDYINNKDTQLPTNNPDEYGIVAAITQNASDPNSGDSKGLLNTADAFQFSADFSIQQSILDSKLPSEIERTDLTITNEGFITENKNYDTPFSKIMDDETGSLTVTAYIDQIPWFVSNGVMPSDISPTKITKSYSGMNVINDRITWKDVSTDYDFKNTLPSKIDETDLLRFDPANFNITSQIETDGNGNVLYPKKTYSVTNRNDDTGEITITAKYDYLPMGVAKLNANAKSKTISKTYTIFKKTDTKKLVFTGSNTVTGNSDIDISKVPQLSELLEDDILPSYFASNVDSTSYLQFINTDQSSGYPTSKMNFRFVPNDTAGTLKIEASLPDGYYEDTASNTFTQTYTGLNKTGDYSFRYLNNITSAMSNMIPSEVTKDMVLRDLIQYNGFNPLDFSISLSANDTNGTLTANIFLTGNYTDSVKISAGFKRTGNQWYATKTFSGFMTKEQQNNKYKLTFKNDTDSSLKALKQYTPKQVQDAFATGGSGLTLNGVKYNTLKDLVNNLLVSEKGQFLPEMSDNDVKVEMYINNGNGTIDFIVKYPESVNGLIFVGSFTGFVLGNDVVTDDNITFKNQKALEAEVSSITNQSDALYKLFDKTVDEFATWIQNKENLKQLIAYQTGQYMSLIDSNDYTLTTYTNDVRGTVSFKVIFNKDKLTNKDSIYTISHFYSGFAVK